LGEFAIGIIVIEWGNAYSVIRMDVKRLQGCSVDIGWIRERSVLRRCKLVRLVTQSSTRRKRKDGIVGSVGMGSLQGERSRGSIDIAKESTLELDGEILRVQVQNGRIIAIASCERRIGVGVDGD